MLPKPRQEIRRIDITIRQIQATGRFLKESNRNGPLARAGHSCRPTAYLYVDLVGPILFGSVSISLNSELGCATRNIGKELLSGGEVGAECAMHGGGGHAGVVFFDTAHH